MKEENEQVPENFPAFRAYMLFTQIGVRHVVVTTKDQLKPIGVLTRKDLLPYDQLRRMNSPRSDRASSLESAFFAHQQLLALLD